MGHTWIITNSLVNNFRYGFTRDAFTNGGDSQANSISFRFIFSPLDFTRTLARTTPVHNFVNDQNWTTRSHNFQYGANIRLIRNARTSFARAFDSAITNPSFYDFSGAVVLEPIDTDCATPGGVPCYDEGFSTDLRDSLTAVIGRYSQYSANFNFSHEGQLQPVGQGVGRQFATQEYEFYFQDTWKVRHDLTLTAGLRWGTSTPVYETTGFEAKPTLSLGEYFQRRVAGAKAGQPFNDLVTVDLSGKANGRSGLYKQDWNNWAPRVAAAWQPHFESGFLKTLFGAGGKSVFRGGFGIFYDRIGSNLAVQFDLNNTLGFASTFTSPANTYNVTDRPAPLFTGFDQTDIRTFPGVVVPGQLTFPLSQPADEAQRIEQGLDESLVTPKSYSWNVSFAREFKYGLTFEAAYLGRQGRDLMATRDIMHLNNLTDPQSGMDWYTAARILVEHRELGTPITSIPDIPFFQNLFPGYVTTTLNPTQRVYRLIAPESVGGFNITDYTFIQLIIDDRSRLGRNAFFQPQYGALSAWSTIASSDYHAGTFSMRQRYKSSLMWAFNYTLSKSLDNASGLQTEGAYGLGFILNPLDLSLNRSYSDFDLRHIIHLSGLWELPFGKGRMFGDGVPGPVNVLIGDWQLSGIFRWNIGNWSGFDQPFDAAQWATNWNAQSWGVAMRPIELSTSRSGPGGEAPNWFADPVAAYRSYRNALAGEVGDRNRLRLPSFVQLDFGLSKRFRIPYQEGHSLQFRWEVFNATNTQRFQSPESVALDQDPFNGSPSSDFGRFTAIQGTARVMQFALRYEF